MQKQAKKLICIIKESWYGWFNNSLLCSEERKKLNRCIEEAPNDYEKEIYRAIRNMPVPYEKLNEILENSRDIITSKQNRKAKNRKFFATGIPIIFMILVVAIYTLLNKQGDD